MADKKTLVVTGAAVVLRTVSGTERYLYRGAPVNEAEFTKDSVKHAITSKLVSATAPAKAEASTSGKQESDEGPYKGTSVADLKAEIDRRNSDREDAAKINPAAPGNRPEIVAALLADDTAQAQS